MECPSRWRWIGILPWWAVDKLAYRTASNLLKVRLLDVDYA